MFANYFRMTYSLIASLHLLPLFCLSCVQHLTLICINLSMLLIISRIHWHLVITLLLIISIILLLYMMFFWTVFGKLGPFPDNEARNVWDDEQSFLGVYRRAAKTLTLHVWTYTVHLSKIISFVRNALTCTFCLSLFLLLASKRPKCL